jgi:hypothetical protein
MIFAIIFYIFGVVALATSFLANRERTAAVKKRRGEPFREFRPVLSSSSPAASLFLMALVSSRLVSERKFVEMVDSLY